ncbi:hypothetical protein [Microbulbifer taiwanensis]|uniref:NrS-1 polymerase-like HBD domain-containing protein n=1 Tax=Microbulbifer taiwanensis TaxID=986746 RepID=A0ABW1YG86_9GAMM|nr:hypothetical protein [Microbulbifer taiwanensis]
MNHTTSEASTPNRHLVWRRVPGTPKVKKIPIDPRTGTPFLKGGDWQGSPDEHCTDYATAATVARALGPEYGVGLFFYENDGRFLIDLDHCRDPQTGALSEEAGEIIARFPGCYYEVSTSGTGIHIIGTGRPSRPHRNRRGNVEFYTGGRFVALTGTNASGDISTLAPPEALDWLVETYLHLDHDSAPNGAEWTTEPDPAWTPLTDEEIIEKACSATSGGAVFGGRATFWDLWTANEDALARAYPSATGDIYDRSSADAALAQHLAFWTGRNCEAVHRLMWQSALVRDKWNR